MPGQSQSRPSFGCGFCLQLFDSREALLQHKEAEHYEKIPNKAKQSPQKKPEPRIIKTASPGRKVKSQTQEVSPVGRKSKTAKRHICRVCKKSFAKVNKLRDHMNLHTGALPYKCPKCNIGFHSSDGLWYHKSRNENTKDGQCVQLKLEETVEPLSAKGQISTTNGAIQITGTKVRLGIKATSPGTGRKVKLQEGRKSLAVKSRRHICRVCKKSFARVYNLRDHMNLHTGALPYQCPKCNLRFHSSDGLWQHKNKNESTKNGRCAQFKLKETIEPSPSTSNNSLKSKGQISPALSGKPNKAIQMIEKKTRLRIKATTPGRIVKSQTQEFSPVKQLQEGRKSKTSKLRRHICRVCKKSFAKVHNLRDHTNLHTGALPYQCPKCNLRFHASDRLWQHKSRNESTRDGRCVQFKLEETIEPLPSTSNKASSPGRIVKSQTLGSFKVKLQEGRKSKTSSRLTCTICKQSFLYPQTLRHHMNLHTGALPFQCPKCKVRFHSSDRLWRHRRKNEDTRDGKCVNVKLEETDPEDVEAPLPLLTRQSTAKVRISPALSEKLVQSQKRTKFTCHICHKQFDNKSRNSHMRLHSGDRPYGCGLCKVRFISSKSLRQHKLGGGCNKMRILRHGLTSSSNSKNNVADLSVIPMSRKGLFECKVCKRIMTTKRTLIAHMSSHGGDSMDSSFRCSLCPNIYDSVVGLHIHQTKVHRIRDDNGSGIISPTAKTTPLKSESSSVLVSPPLLESESIESQPMLLTCQTCGKTLNPSSLLSHMKLFHPSVKPQSSNPSHDNMISITGNLVANSSGPSGQSRIRKRRPPRLTKKNRKEGLGKHPCPYCGMKLSTGWNLKVHIAIHTHDTPFGCKKCGEHFKHPQLRRKHTKTCDGKRKVAGSKQGKGIDVLLNESPELVVDLNHEAQSKNNNAQSQDIQSGGDLSEDEAEAVSSLKPSTPIFTGWMEKGTQEPSPRKFLSSAGSSNQNFVKQRIGGPRTCPYCLIIFNSVTIALEHRKTCSKKVKSQKQSSSGLSSSGLSSSGASPSKSSNGFIPEDTTTTVDLKPNFPCQYCNMSFTSYKSMCGHLKAHGGQNQGPPAKKIKLSVKAKPGRESKTTTTAQRNKSDVESEVGSPKLETPVEDLGSNMAVEVKQPWPCPFCDNVSDTGVALKVHIRSTHI